MIDGGIDPGAAHGFDMTPQFQYVPDANQKPRINVGAIDIGAYEFGAKDAPTQYQLTMIAETGGTVSPQSALYDAGEAVTISATASSGYSFAGWTGSGNGSYTGTANPKAIVMNGPITQTAHFDFIPCNDSDGDGFGSPPGPNCDSPNQADCDDSNGNVYPDAPQLCDGINNDCSSPSWPAVPPTEVDMDGDELSTCEQDCNDSDPNNWTACGSCVDDDSDGYYAGCDAYVTISGPDCNDTIASCTSDCSDTNGNGAPDCSEAPLPPRNIQVTSAEQNGHDRLRRNRETPIVTV